jgi:uncharacterized membrane protein
MTHSEIFLLFGLVAAVNYTLKAGGLFLAERLPKTGPFRRLIDALPGCILVALVAGGAWRQGTVGLAAIGVTVVATRFTRSLFFSLLLGIGAALVAQQF